MFCVRLQSTSTMITAFKVLSGIGVDFASLFVFSAEKCVLIYPID